MTRTPPWRSVYERIAPFLAVFILVIAMCAGIATYFNDRADADRDRAITRVNTQSIDRQEQLLECFDAFATALAGGLPPVRAASANWNDAVSAVVRELTGALVKTLDETVTPPDVQAVIDAGRAFVQANEQLTQAREDNPYPEAPSQFCGT